MDIYVIYSKHFSGPRQPIGSYLTHDQAEAHVKECAPQAEQFGIVGFEMEVHFVTDSSTQEELPIEEVEAQPIEEQPKQAA